jgi:hypothetical protein
MEFISLRKVSIKTGPETTMGRRSGPKFWKLLRVFRVNDFGKFFHFSVPVYVEKAVAQMISKGDKIILRVRFKNNTGKHNPPA